MPADRNEFVDVVILVFIEKNFMCGRVEAFPAMLFLKSMV